MLDSWWVAGTLGLTASLAVALAWPARRLDAGGLDEGRGLGRDSGSRGGQFGSVLRDDPAVLPDPLERLDLVIVEDHRALGAGDAAERVLRRAGVEVAHDGIVVAVAVDPHPCLVAH